MCVRLALACLTTTALLLPCKSVTADEPKPDKFAAKQTKARLQIETLTKAVELHKAKHGDYPAKLQDLTAKGYIKPADGKELLDPWGKEYRYDPKGKRNGGKKPDIWTVAPDKNEIGNWMEEKKDEREKKKEM